MQDSYEFDPCTLDGSDQDDDFVSIDDWKPRPKKERVPKSEWRQVQNAGRCNVQPGIDDIKKIKMYLKKPYPDIEIMESFGIDAATLIAIKRDKYCPIDGISLDNQSKIYNEFRKIEKTYDKIFDALAYLGDAMLVPGTVESMAFRTMIGHKAIKDRQDRARRKEEGAALKKTKAKAKYLTKKAPVKEDAPPIAKKPKEKRKRVNIVISNKSSN